MQNQYEIVTIAVGFESFEKLRSSILTDILTMNKADTRFHIIDNASSMPLNV